MKVLITVSTYFPKKDGVQKVTQYLSEGLVKKGHEVTIITTNYGINLPEEVINGVKIKRVNLYTKFGLYFGNRKEYFDLIDLEANKCDVMINVCTQNAFTDLLLSKLKKYSCKKILYLHGIFDFRFKKSNFTSVKSIINKFYKEIRWGFYYFINGKYFKLYNSVIQLHEKDYANLFFKKKYKIDSMIIENAADDEFFNKVVDNKFELPFKKYLIYVANYDDNKNQRLAVREFLKSNISSDIGLVLIGSRKNNYYIELERYIRIIRKEMKLKNDVKPIKLLYNIDRSLIPSYVSNAYLYIMTSKSEMYPVSIVESIASGVPYICSDVGIVKYFLGGIVSNQNDFHFWIERLLENKEIRDELSSLCMKYADDKFRIEDKINILNTIIEN